MFLASTLFLKKVERIMALLMVMTVCLLVYAALEHRIRKTLKQRTRPNGPGFARSISRTRP
jgi:transposase